MNISSLNYRVPAFDIYFSVYTLSKYTVGDQLPVVIKRTQQTYPANSRLPSVPCDFFNDGISTYINIKSIKINHLSIKNKQINKQ